MDCFGCKCLKWKTCAGERVILEKLHLGCPRGTSLHILSRSSAARGCPGSNLLIYSSLVLWGPVGSRGCCGVCCLPALPTQGPPAPAGRGRQFRSTVGWATPSLARSTASKPSPSMPSDTFQVSLQVFYSCHPHHPLGNLLGISPGTPSGAMKAPWQPS